MAVGWGSWKRFCDARERRELKRSKSAAAIVPAHDTKNSVEKTKTNNNIQPIKVMSTTNTLESN